MQSHILSPFLTMGSAFHKQPRIFNPDFSWSSSPSLQQVAPQRLEASGNHLTDLGEFYVSQKVIKSGEY